MFFVIAVAEIRLNNALISSQKMTLYPVSFHRASIPTETSLPHDLKEDYPNGNMVFREDYQKSFKKEVRWKDIKSFLRTESIGEVYPSYSNGEKDRYVCRPSWQNGVHDTFDRRKQAARWQMFVPLKRYELPSMRGADNMGILVPKKVTGHRIFLGGLHT